MRCLRSRPLHGLHLLGDSRLRLLKLPLGIASELLKLLFRQPRHFLKQQALNEAPSRVTGGSAATASAARSSPLVDASASCCPESRIVRRFQEVSSCVHMHCIRGNGQSLAMVPQSPNVGRKMDEHATAGGRLMRKPHRDPRWEATEAMHRETAKLLPTWFKRMH